MSPRPLFPHQQKALDYCRSTPFPALFMEMRLGKTKVVIEWLRPIRDGKVLVVCPLETVRPWKEQLEEEGEGERVALLLGSSKERMEAFSQRRKWNLINFEGLRICPQLLTNYSWNAIIVDESTRIKNPKAIITKLLNQAQVRADKRCVMSGLPAPEGPLDYCEQFRFLRGDFMGFKNYWSFRSRAFFAPPGSFKWIVKPAFREKIRDFVQRKAFCLSRKEAGLGNRKIYETRYVQMDPKQKSMMKKLEEEFVLELPGGEEKLTKFAPVKLAWMARLAGGYIDGQDWFDGKFKELQSLLCGELAEEQVVVWFRFNAELGRAHTLLRAKGVECEFISGSVDSDRRSEIRKSFQSCSGIRVLLCQQKVGMFGLDLSSASTAIYFSNNYANEVRAQSEDRIEHPLKKEPLLIIDLVTEGTVDEDVAMVVRRKKAQSDSYTLQELSEGIKRRVENGKKKRGNSGNRSRNKVNGMGVFHQHKERSGSARLDGAGQMSFNF